MHIETSRLAGNIDAEISLKIAVSCSCKKSHLSLVSLLSQRYDIEQAVSVMSDVLSLELRNEFVMMLGARDDTYWMNYFWSVLVSVAPTLCEPVIVVSLVSEITYCAKYC